MAVGRISVNSIFAVGQTENCQILYMACLAVAIRAVWAVFIPTIPLSDSFAYDVFAQNIAEYGVYGWKLDEPSAYWPVGTSAIYALLFKIFGHVYWPIVVFNIVLSAVVVAATMRIAYRLYPGYPHVGKTAGVLLVFWPSLIMYVTVLASELPFIAAVVVAADAWTNRERSALWRGLVAGIFFAAASYIRPTALLLPLVMVIHLAATGDFLRRGLAIIAVTYLAMVILIAPWTMRNYQLFNAFVPISTNGGVTLWMGNHPGSTGAYTDLPGHVAGLDDYSRNVVLRQEAVSYIRSDIPGFLFNSLKRLWATHDRETIAVVWNESGIEKTLGSFAKLPLKLIASSYWLFLVLLALTGIVLRFRASISFFRFASDPFLILWVYFAATHAVIIANDRYHFPSIPAVAVFAAIAIQAGLQKIRG